MLVCDRCRIFCETAKHLMDHKKTTQHCQKYQDIIFVCRRCNFNIKDIKNIEDHGKVCTGENIIHDPPVEMVNLKQQVDDEKSLLMIKNTQLENNLKNRDITIMNLQLKLKFEKMKNKIYADIIQTQTNINLENIIQEYEDSVHIYNFENGSIPIVVHDFMDQVEKTEKYTLKTPKPNTKKKIKKIQIGDSAELVIEDNFKGENMNNSNETKQDETKQDETKHGETKHDETKHDEMKHDEMKHDETKHKKTYRTVKKYIKTSEKELGTKLKQDVVRVDKEIDQIVYNNFDVSCKEITEKIESLFTHIENSRKYTFNLFLIQKLRKKLLGKLNLEEYTLLLQDHIKRLESIFSKKNYNNKKITKIIYNSLTPLDMRLVYYKGYTNVTIEIDELQKFALTLDILIEHPKQFIPYDKYLFFNNIKNYGLALFEIQDCIERCLINRYGFNNIMYLSRDKEKTTDPYSFYTLEKVGAERCWKMECRLEDFAIDFIDNVLPYCVNIFRKIYKDVFSDNIYRKDYMGKTQITEFDCEQLIQNIILMGQPMKLCKIFQDIIITNSTFTLTESDKLNLHSDDKLQQKKFASGECGNGDDIEGIIKSLFDGISKEDVDDVLSSR